MTIGGAFSLGAVILPCGAYTVREASFFRGGEWQVPVPFVPNTALPYASGVGTDSKRERHGIIMTDQSYAPTDNIGYLRFSVGTAGNTLPVRDATVYVYTEGGGSRALLYTLVSDEDGITSTVALPTPPLAESFLPRGPIPFSTYSIYATKEGFYPSEGRTVPLFPSITSIQPINLIPVSALPDGASSVEGGITE